jgi:DNA-binding XRE family transcriptional regulator
MLQSTKIKQLREKKGLSQEKLARLADVSNNTIVNIESGKQTNPTIETVSKIAKALDVAIEEIISL